MYDGFSGQARKAVQLARGEAKRLGQDCVSTGHLLLGVLQEGSEGVTRLLAACGLDPAAAYRGCEPHLPRGQGGPDWDRLPLTPAVKRALACAREEAAGLGHRCVGPEHLLLGILRESDGEAALVLAPLGVTAPRLREELRKGPGPENRDWMLRPEPPGGLRAPADPSVRDLEAVVTEEVVPAARPEGQRDESARPKDWSVRRAAERPLRPDEEIRTLDHQLRVLQVVVATCLGIGAGMVAYGKAGALIGFLAGCVVVKVRSTLLGVTAGMITAVVLVLETRPSSDWVPDNWIPPFGVVFAAILGGLLGDWRRLRGWSGRP